MKFAYTQKIPELERAFIALRNAEKENGRNKKISVFSSAFNNKILKNIITMTYDWRICYWVRCESYTSSSNKINSKTVKKSNYKSFCKILKNFTNGVLSGNAAKEELSKFFKLCSSLEKKWYSRIINRNLKIGCSGKTFNVVWKDLIPKFGVQTGIEYDDFIAKGLKIKFPVFVEKKIDGTRGVFVKKEKIDRISVYSRGGFKLSQVVPHMIKSLNKKMVKSGLLDGEFYCKWSKKDEKLRKALLKNGTKTPYSFKSKWGKTRALLKRGVKKSGEYVASEEWLSYVRNNLIFYSFDLPSKSVFMESKCFTDKNPLRKRRKRLVKLIKKLPKEFRYPKQHTVNSKKELNLLFKYYLKKGYEGIMAKSPDSPYTIDRSDYWWKRKKFKTDDFKVVGYREGTGRLKGTLGSLTILKNGKEVRVGIGMTDKKRDELWKKRKSIKYIEVRRQDDKVAKMRFGSLRIRDDKK